MKNVVLTGLLCIILSLGAQAQLKPRPDDHFWRRKVVNRIDLNEKINSPLIKRESPFYTDNSQFADKSGLVMTLFDGLKAGRYMAYNPDTLDREMSYEDVLREIREIEGALLGGGSESFDDVGDGGGFEEFSAGDKGGDMWGGELDGEFGDPFADEFGSDPYAPPADDLGGAPGGYGMGDFDPAPFEQVIQFVEDRIFDKVRSDMVYDIQFIEIIWTDPGETLPEKKLCTFRYDQVLPTLDSAQWKNRFNDAQYRTMREVFEMRLFHSYIIDISGQGMRSLPEAEYRRQKLIEFEHHLWNY